MHKNPAENLVTLPIDKNAAYAEHKPAAQSRNVNSFGQKNKIILRYFPAQNFANISLT